MLDMRAPPAPPPLFGCFSLLRRNRQWQALFDKYVKIAAAIVKTLPAEDVPAVSDRMILCCWRDFYDGV